MSIKIDEKCGIPNKVEQFSNRKRRETINDSRNKQSDKSCKKLTRSKSEPNIFSDVENKIENDVKITSSNEDKVPKLKYKCSFENCSEYFRREKDLDKHEYQHNSVKKYLCNYPECTKSYRLRAHLKRHIQTFHEKRKNEKILKCGIVSCNKQFVNKYNLQRHLKEYHEKIRKFPCTECNRVYERKNHLKLHLAVHTKEYPYKCYRCEEKFVTEAIIKRHNCSKYSCDNCKETFCKWSKLVKHRREKHQPDSFACDKCDKAFKTKQKLKIHKKCHKEKEIQLCPWEGCTNSYLDRKNLKNHINIKHLGKTFKCTVEGCSKELSSQSRLNYHLRVHEKGQEIAKRINKTENRKKRKDAGIIRKSMVGILADIVLKPKDDSSFSEYDINSETDTDDKSTPIQFELKSL